MIYLSKSMDCSDGALIPHFKMVFWDQQRWPNFEPSELACPCCGQFFYWPKFFDKLQAVRTNVNRPIKINSAHRCWHHNAKVGGAPRSQHKTLATDLSLKNHDRHDLAAACRAAGFHGFGFYNTFLHVDLGRRRFWYGNKIAKEKWNND